MIKFESLTEEKLLLLGFEKQNIIIHPSRFSLDDEQYIGQKDENNHPQPLFVLQLPRMGRFACSLIINYRREILGIKSGFMAGGIEIYPNLENIKSEFYRYTGVYEFTQNIITKILSKEVIENDN